VRALSWIITIPVALVAISFALTNRQDVTIGLWPLPFELSVPFFVAALIGVLLGFLAGGLVAWAAQHRNRARARRETRRAERLEQELAAERAARAEADRRLAEAARQVSNAAALLPPDASSRRRLQIAAR
jgi:lysylphosphatidylglycerol synthetase-like protein (DUF2156 family)